jgi:hypothetical protein
MSGALPCNLLVVLELMELCRQLLASPLAKGFLDEPAGVTTACAGKTLGFDLGFASGRDDDFDDRLRHAAPPAT